MIRLPSWLARQLKGLSPWSAMMMVMTRDLVPVDRDQRWLVDVLRPSRTTPAYPFESDRSRRWTKTVQTRPEGRKHVARTNTTGHLSTVSVWVRL